METIKKINKYILLTVVFFIFTYGLININKTFFFNDLKENIENREIMNIKNKYKENIERIEKEVKNYNSIQLETELNYLFETNNFDYIEFKYTNYLFKKDLLLKKYINLENEKFYINNIKSDLSIGEIIELTDNLYEYKPKIQNIETAKLLVSAYNGLKIKDITIELPFYKKIFGNENKIYDDIDLNIYKITYQLKMDEENIATIITSIKPEIISKIYNEEKNKKIYIPSIFVSIIFYIIILIIYGYYKINIKNSLIKLEEYMKDVSEKNKIGNIINLREEKNKRIKKIKEYVEIIVKKYQDKNNEAEEYKEIINNLVDKDIKTNFLNYFKLEKTLREIYLKDTISYIACFKLNEIEKLSKEQNIKYINEYILHLSHILKKEIDSKKEIEDKKIYKISTTEFILVINNKNKKEIENVLNEIKESIHNKINKNYKIIEENISISAIPFNKFEQIDKNLKEVIEKTNKGFYVEENIENKEIENEIENEIKKMIVFKLFKPIIKNETEIYNNEKKFIKTITPEILNKGKMNLIPFFTTVEKLNLSLEVDKEITSKTLKMINETKESELEETEFEITISINTIKNQKFITWLKELKKNKEINLEKLIFSISIDFINENKKEYKIFEKEIKKLGIKNMIKNVNIKEKQFEILKDLNINYLRVKTETTTGIFFDTIKQNRMIKYTDFCYKNKILLICNKLINEEDKATVKSLNVYGGIK